MDLLSPAQPFTGYSLAILRQIAEHLSIWTQRQHILMMPVDSAWSFASLTKSCLDPGKKRARGGTAAT